MLSQQQWRSKAQDEYVQGHVAARQADEGGDEVLHVPGPEAIARGGQGIVPVGADGYGWDPSHHRECGAPQGNDDDTEYGRLIQPRPWLVEPEILEEQSQLCWEMY